MRRSWRSDFARRKCLNLMASSVILLIVIQYASADGPSVSAKSFALIDPDSNQVLAMKSGDVQFEPASTTKLMTAYLVFQSLRAQHIDLQQRVLIGGANWKRPGTTMYLHSGMQVPVHDLIKGLLVQSGNDAAYVLAELVGGTVEHFVNMMNAEARRLGMHATHFLNPAGLPEPGHLSSALDIGTLAVRLVNEFPEYAHYFAIKEYHYRGTPIANSKNRNALLFIDPSVTGMKTGYTEAAGYCLVVSARRRIDDKYDRGMVLVLLGAESQKRRGEEAVGLINWGYRTFQQVHIDQEQARFDPLRVWKGATSSVPVGFQKAASLSLPGEQAQSLRSQSEFFTPVVAPVEQGQQVGVMRWSYQDILIRTEPIVALQAVEEGGWLSRVWGSLCLLIIRIMG